MPLPPSATQGEGLASFDTVTGDPVVLTGSGLPVVAEDGTSQVQDGSDAHPIELPNLKVLAATDTFPFLVVANGAGQLMLLPATTDNSIHTAKILRSFNSLFQEVAASAVACFDQQNICDCIPAFLVGLVDNGQGGYCLTKVTDALINSKFWADSSSITISGQGLEGTPYSFALKFDTNPDTMLEQTGSGVFVASKIPSKDAGTLPDPTTSNGFLYYVDDANATTRLSTYAGGGSNRVMIFSNGTNWVIL